MLLGNDFSIMFLKNNPEQAILLPGLWSLLVLGGSSRVSQCKVSLLASSVNE